MVQATAKSATSWFMIAVSVVWSPSASGDRQIGDLPFNESSVVFM